MMNNSFKRIPIVKSWTAASSSVYDLFIATIGYESRAKHIAGTFPINARHKRACAFPQQHILKYDENLQWFRASGFIITEVKDTEFRLWCSNLLDGLINEDGNSIHICIDISSFDRFRIATFIDVARRLRTGLHVNIDFLYSLAEYSNPDMEPEPNIHVGPVIQSFAGWNIEPDMPPVAIVGVGYEQDKALGAVEHIQASAIWAFIPNSPISEYKNSLANANQTLLEMVRPSRRLEYQVGQPLDLFITLESLTNRLLRSSSPIIFPFGPKIFTLCSLLVACLYSNVALWRVSSGSSGKALDRIPSPYIYGLSVEFIPLYDQNSE